MKLKRAVILGLLCTASISAMAQWQWLDKDGRKVFSDRPPPVGTPQKDILKQPGVKPSTALEVVPAAGVATPAAKVASAPRLPGVDKELEEKKKQAEQAEAARLKAEEEKNRKIKAENCSRAKQAKAGFDSGVRIARTDAKGELEFLDDAARAAEAKRIDGIIRTECTQGPNQ